MATELTIPNRQEPLIRAVCDAVTSPHTKRLYRRALTDFFTWYQLAGSPTFNKATVQRYAAELADQGMSPANANHRLSAIRKLANEAADNGAMDEVIANGIQNVKGIRDEGKKVGNWLTQEQAQALINSPDTQTIKGLRDRAILAVLVGCGLRRQELTNLTFDQIQQRDGRWLIVDLVGKRNKVRSVPMPQFAKNAIDEWAEAAGIIDGYTLRSLNKAGEVAGDKMTSQAVYNVVTEYTDVTPHDLRRTFAKLAYKNGKGAPIDQISLALGHESIKTTQDYLGVDLDLENAACDYLDLNIA